MHKVIVNSTPIIALCHIGKLSLLRDLYKEIFIPEAVSREICFKSHSIAKLEHDKSLDWIRVCKIENEMTKFFFKSQLHDGEVEVMILGKECDATLLVIDDKNAKRYAKHLGFNVTGTLGVLLKAKQEGYIDAIKPLINEMVSCGIYIDDRVIAFCLNEANE